MVSPRRTGDRQRGQMLALFALIMAFVVIPAVGMVVDGGYALAQRRAAQNASDFAALAGARLIAERIGGNATDATDANIRAAITASVAANKNSSVTFWTPSSRDTSNNPCLNPGQTGCDFPYYVNTSGGPACHDGTGLAQLCPSDAKTSYVGNGFISVGTTTLEAVGVRVNASLKWAPFFVGSIVGTWTATATATAKGGYAAAGPSGSVFPAGIAEAFFVGRSPCTGAESTNVNGPGACDPQHMTPGTLNVPGGFGWLKFGCNGYGLGQVPPANIGGCQNNKPFLQTEIGPPSNSFGCCTQVKLPGSPDFIGNLPGNKASADCSTYIANKTVVTVPVWDHAYGNGQNAYYHIVGFTGFQITACHGGKDIEGVWRQQFWLGPTTTTNVGFAGQALAVQLVH